jgi:hypothetical protein
MEMRRMKYLLKLLCLAIIIIVTTKNIHAQPPGKMYTVKNGKMMIMIDRKISESSLDSFIIQFDLDNLALKQLVKNGFKDSLLFLGWDIELNELGFYLITKPLLSIDKLDNPVERIIFTEKELATKFPAISGGVIYGHNRFQNKSSFAVNDSVVTFFLRSNNKARSVMLAGSFNNWRPDDLAMIRTDSGWIANVNLGKGKYWYKFIIDGNWTIDTDNQLRENDGLGNMNSVVFKTNVEFKLNGYLNSKNVYLAGSFNNWRPKELQMKKNENGWELPLYLADGTHLYRYIVDGKWIIDPSNPDQFPNEFKETNSVLRIGIPCLFTLEGNHQLPEVVLAGSFNNWRRDELFMKKSEKGWELPYNLGPGNYEYRFASKGKWISDLQPPLVIEPNYTFRLKGFPGAKKVYLSGEFNKWSEKGYEMKREGDEWIFTVHLSEGKHLYKFIVDGEWIIDPGNPLWEQNEHNTRNSVVWFNK